MTNDEIERSIDSLEMRRIAIQNAKKNLLMESDLCLSTIRSGIAYLESRISSDSSSVSSVDDSRVHA